MKEIENVSEKNVFLSEETQMSCVLFWTPYAALVSWFVEVW
jgi:hypothetical protein